MYNNAQILELFEQSLRQLRTPFAPWGVSPQAERLPSNN